MQNNNYKKSVVVPMYNERENIALLVDALLEVGKDFFIILAIFPSSDGTGEIAEELAQKNKRVIVVYRKEKDLESAYYEGFQKALELGCSQIVTMDGDFSHDPQDVPRLFEEGKKYDLVLGSRHVPGGKIVGWGIKRKLMSWGARSLNRLFLQLKTKDCTAGFRCYSGELAKEILSRSFISKGYAFQIEAVARAERANKKIKEIPIIFKERARGKSKVNMEEMRRHFVSLFKMKQGL